MRLSIIIAGLLIASSLSDGKILSDDYRIALYVGIFLAVFADLMDLIKKAKE